MSVLLVYPPFSGITNISLAPPTLAGYLRGNGIPTRVLDANQAFYRHILTEQRIQDGYRLTKERFAELNGRELADEDELQEYSELVATLQHVPRFLDRWQESLFAPIGRIEQVSQITDRLQAITTGVSLVQQLYPDRVRVSHNPGDAAVYHYPDVLSSRFLVDQTADGSSILSGFFEQLLAPVLAETRYSIIGISISFTSQIQAALCCARAAKKIDPSIHVTLGGGFISTTMRTPTSPAFFEIVDSLVLDEGEIPLVKLHQELSSPAPNLSRVPSLHYLSDGEIRSTELGSAPVAEDQPFPDYSDYDLDHHLVPKPVLQLALQSSRGCSWRRCSFCRVHASFMNKREIFPADYVFESVRAVIEQTGIHRVAFVDAAADTEIMAGLSKRLIDSKTRAMWAINFRMQPDVTLERCLLYRQAGCFGVNFGLEAYNDRILKHIRKGISVKNIDRTLSNTSYSGLRSSCYLIAGLPGETEEELLEGFSAVLRMRREGLLHSYKYSNFELQTGSDIFFNPDRYGITEMRFPEGEDLAGSAEYFAGDIMSQRRAAGAARVFNSIESKPARQELLAIDGQEVGLRHNLDEMVYRGMEDLRDRILAMVSAEAARD